MKKVTKISSLVALSLLMLAGCNGGGDSTTKQDNSKYNWTITVSSPVEQTAFITEQCNNFKEENGYTNVKFNFVNYPEGEVDTKVADWSATSAPDVYAFASDKTLSLVQKGALARVPSNFQSQMTKDMTSGAIDAGKLGDNMYAYPYAGDNGYFLYINTDFVSVDQAAKVEDIIAACAEKGVKFGYPLGEAFYSMAMLTTFGASYTVKMNDDYSNVSSIEASYDTEDGLQAAKGFRDLINNPNVMTGTANDVLKAPTQANGLGAIVGGSWNAAEFEEAVKDKLVALKMPTITVDNETKTLRSFLGYKLYGVNPQVSKEDTARLAFDHSLANYLVGAKVQENRFDTFSTAPTNTTVAKMSKVTNNQYVKAINDQANDAIAQTIVPQGLWESPKALYDGIKAGTISTDQQLQEALTALNTAVETSK